MHYFCGQMQCVLTKKYEVSNVICNKFTMSSSARRSGLSNNKNTKSNLDNNAAGKFIF